MVDAQIQQELLRELDRLPVEQQRRVLDFAHGLAIPTPEGTPGSELIKFSGILSPEEAEAMAQTALDLAATLRRSLRAAAEPAPASSPVSGAATAQREPVNVAASLPAPRPAVSLPAEVPKRGRPAGAKA